MVTQISTNIYHSSNGQHPNGLVLPQAGHVSLLLSGAFLYASGPICPVPAYLCDSQVILLQQYFMSAAFGTAIAMTIDPRVVSAPREKV